MSHRATRWWLRATVGMALAALVGGSAYAVPRYRAVPLGDLGGGSAATAGINNHGYVVGSSAIDAKGTTRAFVHDGQRMVALGTLGGFWSWAAAINDAGAITGTTETASGRSHAFLFSNGSMVDLGPSGANACGQGLAINDAGVVVGSVSATCADSRPVLYVNGSVVELFTGFLLSGSALSINGRGEVAGTVDPGGPGWRAFVYSAQSVRLLGTLGGWTSDGWAINDDGVVVGASSLSAGQYGHAFIDSGGQMRDLGTLSGGNSAATAINNRGDVVGWSGHGAPGLSPNRAFLYADGAMHDLNALLVAPVTGQPLTNARAINERGQIAANSCDIIADIYTCRAFRLDPVADAVTEVPTLSTWVLAALSLLLVVAAGLRLRRRA